MTCYYDGTPIFAGRIKYVPSYWDDVRVPATATTRGGANDPTFAKFRDNGAGSVGVFNWRFSQIVSQELFFNAQIPHTWQEETDIEPHVHWAPSDTAGGSVEWGLEYSIATANAVYSTTNIITASDPSDGVALKHQIVGFPAISMTGNKISTMISGRIYRNSPADTYNSPAWLLEIDFHIRVNTPGSRQEYVK